MLALDERNEWRAEMQKGKIPDDVRNSIRIYREQRSRSDWRSTRYLEGLGEAAMMWEEHCANLQTPQR